MRTHRPPDSAPILRGQDFIANECPPAAGPGHAYLVLTDRLTWPATRAVVARLLAGEAVPQAERGQVREAFQGELVSDLVPESIPSLLEQGWIIPATAADCLPASRRRSMP